MRVYGIVEELETLSSDRIGIELYKRREQIKYLREGLKYADGLAYTQDNDLIRSIAEEISKLNKVMVNIS